MKNEIGISLIGLGVVGSGVAKQLISKEHIFTEAVGSKLVLNHVMVRNKTKKRDFQLSPDLFVDTFEEIINDDSTDVVIEVIGGVEPAKTFIIQALNNQKHVVTANKELIAKHGPELISIATENNVRILFEASVAGGTPIISPVIRDFSANNITSIKAIINGTTNYILSRMSTENADYFEVLKDAQKLGYAESDPTNDVEGVDAAYKLAILSSLSYKSFVKDSDVYCEGITNISAKDFQIAKELGYEIKLIGFSEFKDDQISARVHPTLISKNEMLANVNGVLNSVQIETDLIGNVLFHGAGAGSLPTASAVLADVIDISRNISSDFVVLDYMNISEKSSIVEISDLVTKYYIRVSANDQPGVLSQISTILANHQISIASFIQKSSYDGLAELVIMTHEALERSIQDALGEIRNLNVVKAIDNSIRVMN